MKRKYTMPEIEVIKASVTVLQETSGVTTVIHAKDNSNMWEESSDPIFESNKKKLWDE